MENENGDTSVRWEPYFNHHGDPFVIADAKRPAFSIVATVSTAPDDYGRSNAVTLAAAPEMLDLLRRVGWRCPYFGHSDPTSAEKRIRHSCADDQCVNPGCVTYSECNHVAHDIRALLDRLDAQLSGRSVP